MRNASQWYVIQYDIKCPGRGRKILKFLKTCAFALQGSVFAWRGNGDELERLKQDLSQIINLQQDDVRGYLIRTPLRLFGVNPFVDSCFFSGFPPHKICPLQWLACPPAELWRGTPAKELD